MSSQSPSPSQTLIANLDIEAKLAALPLAGALQRRLSALGTLLRVFARDDADAIVLPTPLASERLPRVLDLPVPRLLTEQPGNSEAVQAWSAARAPQQRRRDLHEQALAAVAALPPDVLEAPLAARPSSAPSPTTLQLAPHALGRAHETATVALHRSFGWALAHRLGAALPAAAMLASIDEVEAWLDALEARSGTNAWVGKHPLSAAGRQRIRGRGPLDDTQRRQLRRLLGGREPLLFEPWVERLADIGCCGRVDDAGGVTLWPVHRQLVAADGAFEGIVIQRSAPGHSMHDERHEHDELSRVATATGQALAALGYRGPFGLDAFAHRPPGGGHAPARAFQAFGELNARGTFGLVAHALAHRAFAAHASATRCTLRFQPPTAELDDEPSMPPAVYELLRPAEPDHVGAWLTVEARPPHLP